MSSVRVPRKDFITPRCTKACPAEVDVPRYIRALLQGRYDDAMGVLREKLPLPTVCADACFAPCEDACAYRQFGNPIAIRALKRAVVDKSGDQWRQYQKKSPATGKSVAIIGAGPAGLSAAYNLSLAGHDVSLYDGFPKPGGMMRYGIPRYRLPEERLDIDLQEIMSLGIKFKGDTIVGRDLSLESIKKEHDAIYIATGANSSTEIPLEGRRKTGVLMGWDFLRDVALGLEPKVGSNVVVVGGGNVAIDVALTAKRLGGQHVSVVCLESRDEMPAHPWEVQLAEEEGVKLACEWAPNKILGDDCACGLGLKRCVSVFDDACCFNPSYDEMITEKIDADTVILAVGQVPVLDFLSRHKDIETNGSSIRTNESQSTGEAGIFAGGDVVTGPQSIISAIAGARRAADSIDRYLGGEGIISQQLSPPEDEIQLPAMEGLIRQRNDMAHLATWERQGFAQIEQGLTDIQIQAEASRCLNCDARQFEVLLDKEKCKECGYCVEVCGVDTFGPAEGFNAKGYRPMEVKESSWCVGCLKCFFSCPDFAIDIKELTA